MKRSWDLTLGIDATGHDDAHVRIERTGAQQLPHLNVRTGSLLIRCLDSHAVNSVAEAWAAVQVRVGDWLPAQVAPPRPLRQTGVAYPLGEVIFEGRQPWNLHAGDFQVAVTIGCVQVRVHDRIALDTQVRAWTEASAHATQLFPGRGMPFGLLLRQARTSSIQQAAGELGGLRPRPDGRSR